MAILLNVSQHASSPHVVTVNMAKPDAWPSLEWGDAVYNWGVPGGLTPAMLNDPSFGVGLRATKEGDHSVAAYVDCATVLVRLSCGS